MERTEIVSLYKNTPADGTVVTVCGWAKNIRDSKNIGFIALSDGGCFKTLQVVLEAGKLANYDEVAYKSVTPSAAFTEKRSGARHPISYKRSKSGSSNVMMIFPFRFRTTFFGSISTRE